MKEDFDWSEDWLKGFQITPNLCGLKSIAVIPEKNFKMRAWDLNSIQRS